MAPEGRKSKSRLAKATGAEPASWEDERKNCTPLWREAHVEVKRCKEPAEHFWKLRCRKRGCILEHQVVRFAKMISRDRRSTSYDLASLFSWQAQYFRDMG